MHVLRPHLHRGWGGSHWRWEWRGREGGGCLGIGYSQLLFNGPWATHDPRLGWSIRILYHKLYFNFRLNIQLDHQCQIWSRLLHPISSVILTCCCCIADVATAGGCCCQGCVTTLDSESVTRGLKSWLGVGDLARNRQGDPCGRGQLLVDKKLLVVVATYTELDQKACTVLNFPLLPYGLRLSHCLTAIFGKMAENLSTTY